MNNENNNMGNQISNNNQDINMQNQIQNNNGFNQSIPQYEQIVNPQASLNKPPTNNNYNPATTQFINQQPTAQQPVNNSQTNNSFNQNNMYQQSQVNSFNTMNSNQTNYNPQQPIYQNQSYTNNNAAVNKKSNNRKLFLFLGIGIVVLIAIIIFVVVLMGGDKKENINEYEEDTNINVSNQENDIPNIYFYKGFDFYRFPGYTYEEFGGQLNIYNNSYEIILYVSQVNFNYVKSNYTVAIPKLSSYGYVVGESKVDTYYNVEVVTYQINQDGMNGFYYVLAAPNSSYIYEGIVTNANGTVDYSNINEVVEVVSNSKYNGNYSNYSSHFGHEFDFNNIVE